MPDAIQFLIGLFLYGPAIFLLYIGCVYSAVCLRKTSLVVLRGLLFATLTAGTAIVSLASGPVSAAGSLVFIFGALVALWLSLRRQ